VESVAFLEDIKTVEMFYLQAQLLISQVSVTVVVSWLCIDYFEYMFMAGSLDLL